MNLRDSKSTPTRVYYVITSRVGRTVIPSKPAALKRYSRAMRDGAAPIRLEKFRLDARHLDGLLVHGDGYFDELRGECLREYGGPNG